MTKNFIRLMVLTTFFLLLAITGGPRAFCASVQEAEAAELLNKLGCEVEFSFKESVLRISRVKAFELSGELVSGLKNLRHAEALEVWGGPKPNAQYFTQILGALSNILELKLVGEFFDAKVVSSLSGLTNLRTLQLIDTRVGDQGLKIVAGLKSIEQLELVDHLTISRVGGEALVSLPSLRRLRIGGNWEPRALSSLGKLPVLTTVSIGGSGSNEKLAELKHVSTLSDVRIVDSVIDATTMEQLLEMPNLKSLTFECCAIRVAAVKEFKRLKVRKLNLVGIRDGLPEVFDALGDYSSLDLHLFR